MKHELELRKPNEVADVCDLPQLEIDELRLTSPKRYARLNKALALSEDPVEEGPTLWALVVEHKMDIQTIKEQYNDFGLPQIKIICEQRPESFIPMLRPSSPGKFGYNLDNAKLPHHLVARFVKYFAEDDFDEDYYTHIMHFLGDLPKVLIDRYSSTYAVVNCILRWAKRINSHDLDQVLSTIEKFKGEMI